MSIWNPPPRPQSSALNPLFVPQDPNKKKPNDPNGEYKLFNSAVAKQAQDYDDIMGGYKNLLSTASATNKPLSFSNYTPEKYDYNPGDNVTGSLANLRDLSETGGYSSQDIANLRARGISPIRSIYSSANREIDRNRALKGGFSPGYGAVKAKLAREQSDSIANQMTNVNAGIAERVAQNKIGLAGTYANAAQAESALRNSYGAANTDRVNDASKFNIMGPLEFGKYNQAGNSQIGDIIRGMTSLYGTTPALAALYGGQAMDKEKLQNLMNEQGNNNNMRIISQVLGEL